MAKGLKFQESPYTLNSQTIETNTIQPFDYQR